MTVVHATVIWRLLDDEGVVIYDQLSDSPSLEMDIRWSWHHRVEVFQSSRRDGSNVVPICVRNRNTK